MFKKQILKNGIRLITAPLKNSKTVTVLALFGAGSKYENKKNSGISHFVEHMMFKGTKKRPNTLAISRELDRVGASYNAGTSTEKTYYWVKSDSKHFDLGLDVLSDMLFNSKFEEKEIEKEKGVIVEEINMRADNPQSLVNELFDKLLYGDQPAGWAVTGTKETVRALKRKDFIDYFNGHYVAENAVVAVAGNFEEGKIISKIENYFFKIKKTNPAGKKKVLEKQSKPESLIYFKETDQTHLILGVRAYDIFDKRKYALTVLNLILGGNMSSRLFINVREKKGLAYYVYSNIDDSTDTGCLSASAGVDNGRAELAVSAVLKELAKIKEKGVTAKELREAKEGIEGSANIAFETSSQIASFFGHQEILENKIMTPEQILEKIKAVSREDILAVARDILRPEKLNLAVIGPHKNKTKFEKLLKL